MTPLNACSDGICVCGRCEPDAHTCDVECEECAAEGARGERERIAAHWQQIAEDHQKIANEKRQRAMEAYDDGDQTLYRKRMDSAKTHNSLATTYYRVARETAEALRAERGTQ